MYTNPPEPDPLVSRRTVAREFDRSCLTIKRWEQQKLLGFDQPIQINRNTFHRRSRIELAKISTSAKEVA